jgi:hypothetical protein
VVVLLRSAAFTSTVVMGRASAAAGEDLVGDKKDKGDQKDIFHHAPPKGLRKKEFPFPHLIFRSSSADPQSQNPRKSPAIPAVSCREANALGVLNQIDQIRPESEREFCVHILA